jgi:hypothetical protein
MTRAVMVNLDDLETDVLNSGPCDTSLKTVFHYFEMNPK